MLAKNKSRSAQTHASVLQSWLPNRHQLDLDLQFGTNWGQLEWHQVSRACNANPTFCCEALYMSRKALCNFSMSASTQPAANDRIGWGIWAEMPDRVGIEGTIFRGLANFGSFLLPAAYAFRAGHSLGSSGSGTFNGDVSEGLFHYRFIVTSQSIGEAISCASGPHDFGKGINTSIMHNFC